MANYGATIQKLRKEKGLTQAELGNKLSVSAQAVSKWENNFSQPDLDTLQGLAEVFEITVDDFVKLSNGEKINVEQENDERTVEREVAVTTAQQAVEQPLVEKKEESKSFNECENISTESSNKKLRINGWYLFGLIIAIAAGIGLLVFYFTDGSYSPFVSIVSAYTIFAFIASLGHDVVMTDIFEWGWEKSIHLPGIIFSLDLGGILFALAYKIIIAPIISLLITVLFGILGTIVAAIIGAFAFPFYIPRIFNETFYSED